MGRGEAGGRSQGPSGLQLVKTRGSHRGLFRAVAQSQLAAACPVKGGGCTPTPQEGSRRGVRRCRPPAVPVWPDSPPGPHLPLLPRMSFLTPAFPWDSGCHEWGVWRQLHVGFCREASGQATLVKCVLSAGGWPRPLAVPSAPHPGRRGEHHSPMGEPAGHDWEGSAGSPSLVLWGLQLSVPLEQWGQDGSRPGLGRDA